MAVRRVRHLRGQATDYQALEPSLWFTIEQNNIRGKVNAIARTRFMTDVEPVINADKGALIARLYGKPTRNRSKE